MYKILPHARGNFELEEGNHFSWRLVEVHGFFNSSSNRDTCQNSKYLFIYLHSFIKIKVGIFESGPLSCRSKFKIGGGGGMLYLGQS